MTLDVYLWAFSRIRDWRVRGWISFWKNWDISTLRRRIIQHTQNSYDSYYWFDDFLLLTIEQSIIIILLLNSLSSSSVMLCYVTMLQNSRNNEQDPSEQNKTSRTAQCCRMETKGGSESHLRSSSKHKPEKSWRSFRTWFARTVTLQVALTSSSLHEAYLTQLKSKESFRSSYHGMEE